MDLKIIILSEESQTEKWYNLKCNLEIYHLLLLECNLKKKESKELFLQNRNRPTDIQNKLMVTKEEGDEWAGIN